MVAQGTDNVTPRRRATKQQSLFGPTCLRPSMWPAPTCRVTWSPSKSAATVARATGAVPTGRRHGEGRHTGEQVPRGGHGPHPARRGPDARPEQVPRRRCALGCRPGRVRHDAAPDGSRHPRPRPADAGVAKRRWTGRTGPCGSSGRACRTRAPWSARSTRSTTWSARSSASRCAMSPAPIAAGRTWTRTGSASTRTAATCAPAAGSTSTTR